MVFNADIQLSRVVSHFRPICCKESSLPIFFRRKRAGRDNGDLRDGAAASGGGHSRENCFQSLENGRKFFPIIGKSGLIFPTIGKKFSNHWKTLPLPAGQRIMRLRPRSTKRWPDSPELAGTGRGFSVRFPPKMDSMHSSWKTTGATTPPGGRSGAADCGEARFHGGRPFENTGISQ